MVEFIIRKVSSELFDQNVYFFYHFFNSIINDLPPYEKNLNNFILNEIKNYFSDIINSVFEKKLDFINEI